MSKIANQRRVLVVLGRGLTFDANLTKASQAVANEAVELVKKARKNGEPYHMVVFSGGYSRRMKADPGLVREAIGMAEIFTSTNANRPDYDPTLEIVVEPSSQTTAQNFMFTRDLCGGEIIEGEVTVLCVKAQARRIPFLARKLWGRKVRIATVRVPGQRVGGWLKEQLVELAAYGLMVRNLNSLADGDLDAAMARLPKQARVDHAEVRRSLLKSANTPAA